MNGFAVFHDKGNEVQAHFQGGKADALFYYTFKKKIAEPWLSSVLNLNSKGTPWVLEAKSSTGRQVYRTTDGKYHAFVSNGNQLMIDTDAFFQKAIHQKIKNIIPVDELPECVFAPDHLEAKIGMTEADVIKEYGPSVDAAPDGAKEYRNGYQDIMVHYINGRSDSVLYTADKGALFNDCWVSCLLMLNSQGYAWIVPENSKPNKMVYWTPNPHIPSLIALMESRRSLIVYTRQYVQQKKKGLGKKGSRIGLFNATITPCASIALGDKETTMTKKLGASTLDRNVRVYRDGDLIIRATFKHSTCNRITYTSEKNKKFTDHWVSATLAVNSGGRAWFTFEESTPKETLFRSYDHKFYARLKNGTDLGIMTASVYKQAAHELQDANPNSK